MYYRILGYVDTIDDASYMRKEKNADGKMVEVKVEQYTYNLRIPGQKDFTKVTVPAEKGPKLDVRDKWEDVETMVAVEADRLTTISGGGEDGKPWAFSSFSGTAIQEASQDEQRNIKTKRKAIKAEQKAKRDAAHEARLKAKKAA
jgi:hypothetical protein